MIRPNRKLVVLSGAGILVLAPVLVGLLMGHFTSGDIAAGLEAFLESISKAGVTGTVLVVAVLVLVAFTGVLPASLVGVVGGSLYGLLNGFLISAFAIVVGAGASFALSRSMFRGFFERIFAKHSKFRLLDDEIAKGGRWLVCLLRMSPIMPFALTSYAFGLSSIKRRDYVIGTFASLPALFGYVCAGWLARDGLKSQSIGLGYLHWAILGMGIAATVVLTIYVRRMALRAGVGSP